jgi:hypothetical protein
MTPKRLETNHMILTVMSNFMCTKFALTQGQDIWSKTINIDVSEIMKLFFKKLDDIKIYVGEL